MSAQGGENPAYGILRRRAGIAFQKFCRACSVSDLGDNGFAGDEDIDSTVLLAVLCELLDRLKELFGPKINK